ncbi:MAG TPA: hypothetical protein VGH34_21285 [Vicinamibacterales bacterium]
MRRGGALFGPSWEALWKALWGALCAVLLATAGNAQNRPDDVTLEPGRAVSVS